MIIGAPDFLDAKGSQSTARLLLICTCLACSAVAWPGPTSEILAAGNFGAEAMETAEHSPRIETESHGPQQPTDDPLQVLEGRIDNRRLYDAFMRAGETLQNEAVGLGVSDIAAAIRRRRSSDRPRPRLESRPAADGFDYAGVAKASLMLGTLYDCGRCDQMHGNVAGGVVISDDGLCLTNHHVLDRRSEDAKVLFAMDYRGQGHPIKDVLAVDPASDVALVQLGGDGPFYPVAIAEQPARPGSNAFVLSHPSSEFYALTQGVVSRQVTLSQRRGRSEWLEITAPFGAGSSGSGIFNGRGELIGLVSRIHPLFRSSQQRVAPDENEESRPGRTPYAEMVLRRCVTLEAIHSCFQDAHGQ